MRKTFVKAVLSLFQVSSLSVQIFVKNKEYQGKCVNATQRGFTIIGDYVEHLNNRLKEVDQSIEEEAFSRIFYDESAKDIDRIMEDLDDEKRYVDENAPIAEEVKVSLRNMMERLQLSIKLCYDKLRIKRLEHENHEKNEELVAINVDLHFKTQHCNQLEERLRELEIAREEQEERKIPIQELIIVRILGGSEGTAPYLTFRDYISYKRLHSEIQEYYGLQPDRFSLTYVASDGQMKPVDSPQTFVDAFQEAKTPVVFHRPMQALEIQLEVHPKDNVEGCQTNESDNSEFVEVPASDAADPPQNTSVQDPSLQVPSAPEQPNQPE
ncbi:hypothetical protein EC973_001810 [Apophysomyces ossiformis]|uniref:Uncharacterized protein n=1 Tax=Apophysomyces ossiformis TaxID=679940 RepID=A0A8H7BLH3_9FUNG|nr:hypothetical protein EC973_001810 [Apophysomyces ossiformis]